MCIRCGSEACGAAVGADRQLDWRERAAGRASSSVRAAGRAGGAAVQTISGSGKTAVGQLGGAATTQAGPQIQALLVA